ncbi:DUF559 domain-containing protein [Micromonospora sp. NPDC047134]|uniref:endonuclease domain-containing protein n=1 Tax=Micromonospora sp. NPDC047134 TaxID=3154340 RepID=UPI0033D6CBD0
MDKVLAELVRRGNGLVTRSLVEQVVPEWILQRACTNGELVRVLPEVFAAAHLLNDQGLPPLSRIDPALGRRAVTAWVRGRGALSHLTALDVWGLRQQLSGDLLYASAPAGSGLRNWPGVRVQRRRHFTLDPPCTVVRQGMPVTTIERAIVDSWPMLPLDDQRTPMIRAVNSHLTTPGRLQAVLDDTARLAGREALRTLLTRLADGCRSPLEIWGHERVFTGPGMPTFQRQVQIRLGLRNVYLDLYAEPERVNIELDGATTHGDTRQREIDLRRDAQLAALGILVVRFAHRRLVREPETVRRETLAILASRRYR